MIKQEVSIHESMNSFIEFIRNLKMSIDVFREKFKNLYDIFIRDVGKLSLSERKRHYGSFRKIQKLYDSVNKYLNSYVTNFGKDYSETLSLAIDISSLREELNLLFKQYPDVIINEMGPDELYQLSRKRAAIVDRHNKLAILYNGRIHRFNALKESVSNSILVYGTSDKKSMTISIGDKLFEFQRLIYESFKTNQFLGATLASNFVKNIKNTADSSILAPITLLNPESWSIDPQSWYTVPASDDLMDEGSNQDENSDLNRTERLSQVNELNNQRTAEGRQNYDTSPGNFSQKNQSFKAKKVTNKRKAEDSQNGDTNSDTFSQKSQSSETQKLTNKRKAEDSQNEDTDSEDFSLEKQSLKTANLITKSKLLAKFDAINAQDKINIKNTAVGIFLDCQILSLSPESDVLNELQQVLIKHPYLEPNLKLKDGVVGLVEETLALEAKVITYLKTNNFKNLYLEKNVKHSINDVFEFASNSEAASEIFKYFQYKSLVLQLQYYLMLYRRTNWIDDIINERKHNDEFLKNHISFYKRVHGFTEAIKMEEIITAKANERMISQIKKFVVADRTNDNDVLMRPDKLRDKLKQNFVQISEIFYSLFCQKLREVEFKAKKKRDGISDILRSREEELKSLEKEHELLIKQFHQ